MIGARDENAMGTVDGRCSESSSYGATSLVLTDAKDIRMCFVCSSFRRPTSLSFAALARPLDRPALVTAVILFDPLISRRTTSTYFLSGRCPHKSYSRSTPAHHRSPDSRPWKISDSILPWIYRRPPFVIVQRWNLKTPILAFDSSFQRGGVQLLLISIFPGRLQTCLDIFKIRIVFL